MKAAGRTLTVGELRETMAGLSDLDPVNVIVGDEGAVYVEHAEASVSILALKIEASERLPDDVADFLDRYLGAYLRGAAATAVARMLGEKYGLL